MKQPYSVWRLYADHALISAWGIDYNQAGADEDRMRAFYAEDNNDPVALAEWWGEKYDLHRFDQDWTLEAERITSSRLRNFYTPAPTPPPDNLQTLLATWEAMLDHYDSIAPMRKVWDNNGVAEMRDRVPLIADYAEEVWAALGEDLQDKHMPFDWEFLPKLLSLLAWHGQGPHFPPIEEVVECLT